MALREIKKTEAKEERTAGLWSEVSGAASWDAWPGNIFKQAKSTVVCALMENADPQCSSEKWCRL